MSYSDEDSGELFANVSTIDIKRRKKITIKLQDENGDDIDLKDTVSSIQRYITDQITNDADNKLRDEVFPLVTQIGMSGIVYAMGSSYAAAFVASQEVLRSGMSQQMMLSFYFLKFLQKNNIKVITEEEDVTEEEIQRMIRLSRATGTATLASMMGLKPKEIMEELVASGQITKEDLKSFKLPDEKELDDDDVEEDQDKKKDSSSSNTKDSKSDPNVN